MVIPITILIAGAHGRFSSKGRVRMDTGEWKVAVDQLDLFRVHLDQRQVDWYCQTTGNQLQKLIWGINAKVSVGSTIAC